METGESSGSTLRDCVTANLIKAEFLWVRKSLLAASALKFYPSCDTAEVLPGIVCIVKNQVRRVCRCN